jgi:O-acetyl-ADP-ribose deacetylase (regulator of RNase III)
MGRIRIEEGDLTEVQADAIVNAANTDLLLGSGVAGAIRAKGGPGIQEECDRLGPIPLGEVALTGAGALPARHVIHAAAMELGGSVTEEALRSVTRRSLELAVQQGFHTIAFPAIGTGVGGLSLPRCAEIMLAEIERQLCEPSSFGLEEVRLVLFGEPALRVFEQTLDRSRIERQLGRLREARGGRRP